jgi:hypothetical protein
MVSPEPWLQLVTDRVLTPYVTPDQVVTDAETVKLFDLLESRAKAHAVARGEHDAMCYLHLYAIWNSSLWRAKYDTWEEYCDEWDKAPLGISKSSIKHKVTDIKKALATGVTPETIVKALGNIPMATRSLLDEIVSDSGEGDLKIDQKYVSILPYGMNVDKYLAELAELGPIQANIAVDELYDRVDMFIPEAEFDERTRRLLFKVVSRSRAGDLEVDLHIVNVPEWAARFLVKRLTKGR